MKTTAMPACCCPKCGKAFDAASSMTGDATPAPGDLTVCIRCGALLAFQNDLSVRAVSKNEEKLLGLNTTLTETVAAIRRAIAISEGKL